MWCAFVPLFDDAHISPNADEYCTGYNTGLRGATPPPMSHTPPLSYTPPVSYTPPLGHSPGPAPLHQLHQQQLSANAAAAAAAIQQAAVNQHHHQLNGGLQVSNVEAVAVPCQEVMLSNQ